MILEARFIIGLATGFIVINLLQLCKDKIADLADDYHQRKREARAAEALRIWREANPVPPGGYPTTQQALAVWNQAHRKREASK